MALQAWLWRRLPCRLQTGEKGEGGGKSRDHVSPPAVAKMGQAEEDLPSGSPVPLSTRLRAPALAKATLLVFG